MNIKSLLLGSAAALVAVSGARAADAVVMVEPEPAEYVRICDTYGTGFFYIPGTETCLKVGGYVRIRVLVTAKDAPTLFDLRCYVREGLVSWLHESDPIALPRQRVEMQHEEAGTAPAPRASAGCAAIQTVASRRLSAACHSGSARSGCEARARAATSPTSSISRPTASPPSASLRPTRSSAWMPLVPS